MVLGEKNMNPTTNDITNPTPTNDNTTAPQTVDPAAMPVEPTNPSDPAAMPVMDPPVTPPAPVAEAPAQPEAPASTDQTPQPGVM
jgi:hypothetical protein